MSDRSPEADEIAEKLLRWRQGDYACDVGGFLFADVSEDGDAFDARESSDKVAGLVVISQTCDVVRLTDDKRFVSVSPLMVPADRGEKEIAAGRFPSLTMLEHPPAVGMYVDLARVMSVSKHLLASWDRRPGFTSQDRAIRFAGAIERKMGRFAFPDDFDLATKPFQNRVRERHNKPDSPVGRVYRSIDQLRFLASPNWEADAVEVTLIGVLSPDANRPASDQEIAAELTQVCGGVDWPVKYKWTTPPFFCGVALDLRGSDILASQLADFEYLSS